MPEVQLQFRCMTKKLAVTNRQQDGNAEHNVKMPAGNSYPSAMCCPMGSPGVNHQVTGRLRLPDTESKPEGHISKTNHGATNMALAEPTSTSQVFHAMSLSLRLHPLLTLP